jgi:hypothetical protein
VENENNNINCTVDLNNTDGRINIKFKNFKKRISEHLSSPSISISPSKNSSIFSFDEKYIENEKIPHLAIVILIVGTRGDVQPFIAYVNYLTNKKIYLF